MNTAFKHSLPLMLAVSMIFSPNDGHAKTTELSSLTNKQAERIFRDSGATGMALVVINNDQVIHHSFGETRKGNKTPPRHDSLIRIASITKLITSEVMVKLASEGRLKLTDPLKIYAAEKAAISLHNAKEPITLLNLATHTSGLPREQPGKPKKKPVFTWPDSTARWQWLKKNKITAPPGTSASYSNLAYDLLADALSKAANKPYPQLLHEKVIAPFGMKNTTLTPTREQCARLMIGLNHSPCHPTVAAAGSGGLYSTPEDMQRWMQQFLYKENKKRKLTAALEHTFYFQRHKLTSARGLDVAGRADALGLGWIYMAPKNGLPGIIQKTGGGGGFITYMAMIPEKNIGIFVVATRSKLSRFSNMSNGVNRLVAQLVSNPDIRTRPSGPARLPRSSPASEYAKNSVSENSALYAATLAMPQ